MNDDRPEDRVCPLAGLHLWGGHNNRALGCAQALNGEKGLAVTADGHVQLSGGNPARDLVCIVETERGQETLGHDEFEQRFGWNNNAEEAKLP
jgi:hypothetical protein